MSQEFFCEDDHAEMVDNWVAESIECDVCHSDGCAACGDLGRIALCDTGHDDLTQEIAEREEADQAVIDAGNREAESARESALY